MLQLRCNQACLKGLLVFFTICLVLGTSGIVAWQTMREHTRSIDADNKRLLANARTLAEHAGLGMIIAERVVKSVSGDIGRSAINGGLATQTWQQRLHKKISDVHQFGSVLVVDKNGKGIISSNSFPLRPTDVADREYFLHHLNTADNRLFVGRPVKSRQLGGAEVFTLSKRINDADGNFTGLVAISFLVSYFDQFYKSIAYHPQMQIMLLRTDGWPLVIIPKTEAGTDVNLAEKRLFTQQLKIAPYGVFRNEKALLDNIDRQIAYARLDAPFDNLVAVVSLPRSVILAKWKRQMFASIGGALTLGLFSIILAAILMQRLNYLEQKDLELNSLNERLTLATDAGGIAIWDWDITNDKIHWDKRMYQLHGIQHDTASMTKSRWREALHPDDLAQMEAAIQKALQDNVSFELAYKVIRATDGEIRHLISIAKMYHANTNQQRRLIGISYDITEQKKAELFLQLAKDEAEQTTRLKSGFIASVSHELRTPLNAIVGMTHLLINSQMTVDQREQLEIINSGSRTLLAIINDLLDISRIEAGRIELEQIPYSLSGQILTQLGFVQGKANEKGITLSHAIDPAIPDKLLGDPLRFGQILMNLLSNAIKFTEHGQVSVKVSLVEQKEKSLKLLFQVKDSGIGIQTDRLQEIFSPFTQSDNSVTRRYGGTGLGLAIASQLVKLMNGEIGVESEPGKGSCFFFTFSAQPADAENEEIEESTALENDKPTKALVLYDKSVINVPFNHQKLQALVKKLEKQLKNHNMGAMVTFRQLYTQLAGYEDDELSEMELFLNDLEFAKAITVLYRVAEKLGIS